MNVKELNEINKQKFQLVGFFSPFIGFNSTSTFLGSPLMMQQSVLIYSDIYFFLKKKKIDIQVGEILEIYKS